MILSDIQPQYFPRLNFFARMFESNQFIIKDEVQFVNKHRFTDGSRGVSHQVHSPIKTNHGPVMLTVSAKKGSYLPISKTLVSYDQPWLKKQLNQIKHNYSKSPQFEPVFSEIQSILESGYETVAKLNTTTICWAVSRLLGVDPVGPEHMTLKSVNSLIDQKLPGKLRHIILGTEVDVGAAYHQMSASEKIARLCTIFGATDYITGRTAYESYLDLDVFSERNINVRIQQWLCEPYAQQYMDVEEFTPNLSIIDLLMNCSPGEALDLLLP
ncbi:MAG: WbqC family protein [Gammaproteobacteria bacterium]|nr:WbqC family protein [Gammaproteobacteria bacterium]MDH3859789.1 WbqC family protein [Gammaproteobacteria bacterium]